MPGRGVGFSLEAPTGQRFLTRSRVIPAERLAELPEPLTGAEVEAAADLPEAYAPVEWVDPDGSEGACQVIAID